MPTVFIGCGNKLTKLLKRLTTIADMVIKDKAVADIGADHALLSIYMMERRLISNAIVTDIIDGPYERAKKAVNDSPYRNNIEVRKGDGIDIINPHEVATVIIAGMGGDTIADIISRDWDKSESFTRFILQPMSRPNILRKLLANRGWVLLEERLVYENGKYFIILSYKPNNTPYELSPLEIDIGPMLLIKTYEYKREYLQSYLAKYKAISNSLNKSPGYKEHKLLLDYQDKIRELEEILGEIG